MGNDAEKCQCGHRRVLHDATECLGHDLTSAFHEQCQCEGFVSAPSPGATAPDEPDKPFRIVKVRDPLTREVRSHIEPSLSQSAAALAPLGERPDAVDAYVDRVLAGQSEANISERALVNRIAALRASLQAAREDSERLDAFALNPDWILYQTSNGIWHVKMLNRSSGIRVVHGSSAREVIDRAAAARHPGGSPQ